MTPPIRIPLPRLGDSIEISPLSPPAFPTREMLGLPRFSMSPWLPSPVSSFRLSPLFAQTTTARSSAATAAAAATPLRFVDFLPAIYALAEGIEVMDLDVFNVPVNRGSGLCRYSEFTPRATRPAPGDCSVTVHANTRARVHGEIRPIRGTDESLITRFSVDFSPDVFNNAAINALRIDGFSGVDAPDLSYDMSFATRSPVLSSSGGDTNYENFFAAGGPVNTPFDHEAEPPLHRDFMIRFAPVEPTVLSALQSYVGANRLLLWAFLPTMGISEPSMFEALGVRYNTLPRRFGDLLRLFAPLFSRERRWDLRQAAPYINPNSEVILEPEELAAVNAERAALNTERESRGLSPLDPPQLVGLRQELPSNRTELLRWAERRERINVRRTEQNLPALPPITTNRGPVIDWVFSDLASDPTRLAALTDSELPALTAHARLNATQLTLPMGRVNLNAGTEIHFRYALERVANPAPGASSIQRVIDVRIEPVELAAIQLDAGLAEISADQLNVQRLEFRIRSPIMSDPDTPSPGSEMEVSLNGVQAENLGIRSAGIGLSTTLSSARLTSLSLRNSPSGLSVEVNGLEAEGAHFSHSALNVDLASVSVPTLRLERSFDAEGEAGPIRISVPDLGVEGIEGSGRVPIRDGSFHLRNGEIELQRGRSVYEGDLDLRGNFPTGFSDGPIALDTLTIQPAVEDLRVQGRARYEVRPAGFRLSRSEGAAPLNISFRIGPSWLEHRPAALPAYLSALAASSIIQTRIDLRSAEVQVEDLREVEFGTSETPEGRRGQIRQLQCGPISVHHIEASGSLWAGLPIWGYVRGYFPVLGGGSAARSVRSPDMSPLLRHLPEAARTLLGDGDFFRIGGVNLHRDPNGAWQTSIEDLLLALREVGGRGQFAGIRVHHFNFGVPESSPAEVPNLLGPTDIWINAFMHDPERGGSFRFYRWPR